jgi:peptide-methionine (S)-S-oxide reductase
MRPTLFGICFIAAAFAQSALAEEAPHVVPAPALDDPSATAGDPQTAVLAGGCYWGTQGIFEHVKGIQSVTAGFEGRRMIASQEDDLMRRADAGPAESVKIVYDPAQISFGQILQIYFSVVHDPTQVDRQGPDTGPQYRSEIFYSDNTQQKIAEAYVAQLGKSGTFHAPLATRTAAEMHFSRAPGSEQDFMVKHANLSYIVENDAPRLAALKTLFPNRYQAAPSGPAND